MTNKKYNDPRLAPMIGRGWIGVDLDGTLAEYHKGQGLEIGKPIPKMVRRVLGWLADGHEVRIMTARASVTEEEGNIAGVNQFSMEQFECILPVTCMKDFHMIEQWDDRAVQVIYNTGETLSDEMAAKAVVTKGKVAQPSPEPFHG